MSSDVKQGEMAIAKQKRVAAAHGAVWEGPGTVFLTAKFDVDPTVAKHECGPECQCESEEDKEDEE